MLTPNSRVKRGEDSRQVYEAWNIYYCPDRREYYSGTKVLGFELDHYDTFESYASVVPQPSEQSDLADTHLRAVKDFQDKHRRGWAGRLFRGKGKTYEQNLDERCGKLPERVKQAINTLLLDKERATSTRYRTRTWTVVSMREQLFYRFANADFPEVKPQKNRFWKKNKTANRPMMYSVVIQGRETKVCSSEEGITTFQFWDNPWASVDNAEVRQRNRERRRQQESLREKRRFPSPPSYRSDRERSISPPSYRSPRSRYASPPSYRERQARPYIRSRSLSPRPIRIRVQRRDRSVDSITEEWSSPFTRDPFSAVPTPPESYTPPPAVSAYSRPSFPPPPMPHAQPFHHPFPAPLPPVMPPSSPFSAPGCKACQTVPACLHHVRMLPCPRPLQATINGIATHPPCNACFGNQGSPIPLRPLHFPLSSCGPPSPPPPPRPMYIPPPPMPLARPPFAPFTRPSFWAPGPLGIPPLSVASSSSSSVSSASSRSSSRSSSPSPSQSLGWRKTQVEDYNDDLSDTATDISEGDGAAAEVSLNNGSVADGENGDQAPELVPVQATSPSVV